VSLNSLETLLLSVFLLLLMLGMGATLSLDNFRAVLRRPLPVVIGLASQFGWMPAIAYTLAVALDLSPAAAVGLVIMGCSSGGTTSNFFTYLSRADLALSISMTVVSTLVAIAAIPLLLWLYTRGFSAAGGADLAVPYANIVTTLVVVLVPVLLGIGLRSRSTLWAGRAERWGTRAGFAMLLLVILANVWREGAALLQVSWQVYLAATLLGPIGFLLGLGSARLLRLEPSRARAVSLETGIQNAPLALGIILISFDASVQREMLVAPMLYGVIVVPFSALAAALFRRADRAAQASTNSESSAP